MESCRGLFCATETPTAVCCTSELLLIWGKFLTRSKGPQTFSSHGWKLAPWSEIILQFLLNCMRGSGQSQSKWIFCQKTNRKPSFMHSWWMVVSYSLYVCENTYVQYGCGKLKKQASMHSFKLRLRLQMTIFLLSINLEIISQLIV